MSKARRPPPAPGRGAAIARQMGLLPEPGAEDEEGGAGLEAELLELLGGSPPPAGGERPPGRAPLPMEAIERMAALCMRDPPEEEEEEEEDEEDLMAELQEVLGDAGGGGGAATTPSPPPVRRTVPEPPPDAEGLEQRLRERAAMYRAAIGGAGGAGDAPRLRRYQRGLKTLETLLADVKKGKKIQEDEIPPPVALGKGVSPPQPPQAPSPPNKPPQDPPQPPQNPPQPPQTLPQPPKDPPQPVPASPEATPAPSSPCPPPGPGGVTEALLRDRQRGYKLAALRAKQGGDLGAATELYRVAKSLEPLLEAVGQGRAVGLSQLPPPADQLPKEPLAPPSATPPGPDPQPPPAPEAPPAPPRDALGALQQRLERYRGAAAAAEARGEARKARMHQRIVTQYQAAIRALKAGKTVDFSELPVPPGFQPIPGTEAPAGGGGLGGLLEAAAQLVQGDPREEEEEEDGAEEAKPPPRPAPARAPQPRQPPPPPQAAAPPNPAVGAKPPPKNTSRAQQQLQFLEGRRRRLLEAALGAKRLQDLEGAKVLLRQAKGLEPLLQAARSGLPVDIAKVPEAPVNKEAFVLGPRWGGGHVPPEAAGQYLELVKLLRQQHEMCMNYSKQFTRLGNIVETTKLEALAEECRRHMETLKQAHARGCPPPKHRYEQRTFSLIKTFPELNGNDLVLSIVRGINLPAPPGVTPRDLDAFVRFEFPYPSAEEAQKDKTNVIKNTDSPEFREQFKLFMNRGHRGLRRVLHGKGIKFEVAHKGGLFKAERVLGWAQLKLEGLETACEVREILELLEGRRPTGGKLEVRVRIREPLGPPQLEMRTEPWLVIDPGPPPPPVPKPKPAPPREGNNRAVPPLPSLALLAFDREKLERKMLAYRQGGRPVPPELQQQHQELLRRSQSLREGLQRGGPPSPTAYRAQLERYLQLFTEAARRLGTEGNREAAKEALYKRNLVENELRKLRQ